MGSIVGQVNMLNKKEWLENNYSLAISTFQFTVTVDLYLTKLYATHTEFRVIALSP